MIRFFLRGFAEGGNSQDVSASPPSALSSPWQRFLGGKKLELGLGSGELRLCPSPEEKGPGGISWLPRRGIQGMESQGIPGGGWQEELIQEEFTLEEFTLEGFIQGEFIREDLSRRNSPRRNSPRGWGGAWKRGKNPKESYSSS